MQRGNLAILVVCQLISATGSIVFVTLGGIIGARLTPDMSWATLPVSMAVVATAMSTVPAAALMRRLGRSRGFALGSLSAAAAVLIAALALGMASFSLFLAAAACFGINMAFTQQYRYAAAESVHGRHIPRAVSFVLLGSIGGALLGPEIAKSGQDWIAAVPYAGVMVALAALYGLQALLLLALRQPLPPSEISVAATDRDLGSILRQPVFVVAVLGGAAGYALMAFVMTATPLSMHVHDGHGVDATANVIRAHVLGMYVPSLVSGILIEKIGVVRMMLAGVLGLLATSVVGLQGQSVLHYGWALVLLGVGWNFLYVGATAMLTLTYSAAERFRAQAANEAFVFGLTALASLLAGTVMHYAGWRALMWMPVPILLLVGAALLAVRNDVLLRRPQALPAGPA